MDPSILLVISCLTTPLSPPSPPPTSRLSLGGVVATGLLATGGGGLFPFFPTPSSAAVVDWVKEEGGGAPADGGRGAGLVLGLSDPLVLKGEPIGFGSPDLEEVCDDSALSPPISSPASHPKSRLRRTLGGVSFPSSEPSWLRLPAISAASSRMKSG